VTNHAPPVHLVEFHHVWPLGMGGPDVRENTVLVCPTTHSETHRLINATRHHRVLPDLRVNRLTKQLLLAWVGYAQRGEPVGSLHTPPPPELWAIRHAHPETTAVEPTTPS